MPNVDQPVLVVPVVRPPGPDDAAPNLLLGLRRISTETVAEAFTSPERLVDACGPAQPFVVVPVPDALRVFDQVGATVLVVDIGDAGAVTVDVRAAARAADGRVRGWIGGTP